MNFFGDYHTHTIYSRKPYVLVNHAKGSIEDNISQAKEIGLKEIALTDHGFNHIFFGTSIKRIKKEKQEVVRLSQKYGLKVYLGVEANFISTDGSIDVKDEDMKYLDIVLCGYHKTARCKTIREFFSFKVPNFFARIFGSSKKLVEKNTSMVINAIKKNNIDILTHLNSKIKCDVEKVAKEASKKGTYIELNEKHCDFTPEEIEKMLKTDVMFIVDSDAHSPAKIGKFNKVETIIQKYNIPKERIANLDKLPKFLNLQK